MDTLEKKSFDAFDENDLALVLTQVARRMLVLRKDTPDIGFWHSTIFRVSKFLGALPTLTEAEKNILLVSNGTRKIDVIRSIRQRTGFRLRACSEMVKSWIAKNMPETTIGEADDK
jgi:hypothetical protein